MVNTMSDADFLARFDVLFSPTMRLAHDVLLNWAGEMEPDGWPGIPAILRFARCYGVPSGELAALCGVLSYRLGNKTVYCDARACHRPTDSAKLISRKSPRPSAGVTSG